MGEETNLLAGFSVPMSKPGCTVNSGFFYREQRVGCTVKSGSVYREQWVDVP